MSALFESIFTEDGRGRSAFENFAQDSLQVAGMTIRFGRDARGDRRHSKPYGRAICPRDRSRHARARFDPKERTRRAGVGPATLSGAGSRLSLAGAKN